MSAVRKFGMQLLEFLRRQKRQTQKCRVGWKEGKGERKERGGARQEEDRSLGEKTVTKHGRNSRDLMRGRAGRVANKRNSDRPGRGTHRRSTSPPPEAQLSLNWRELLGTAVLFSCRALVAASEVPNSTKQYPALLCKCKLSAHDAFEGTEWSLTQSSCHE